MSDPATGTLLERSGLDSPALNAALLGLLGLGCIAVTFAVSGVVHLLLTLALLGPLLARRTHPTASTVAVFAAGLVQLLLNLGPQPADVAVLIALYSVTAHGPRLVHRIAIGTALTGAAIQAGLLALAGPDLARVGTWFLVMVVAALAAWSFGLVRRIRREQLEALHERADRLERESRQQAAIATAGERARIAREMHDVVAHSLSVIIAQADGGRYAGRQDPASALRSLGTIGETGRAALADMRAILGVLRRGEGEDGGRSPSGPPQTAPQPATADLETLVQQTRDAGLTISLVRIGSPRALPAGAGLTLYRICQEALTNVLKHAGPGPSVTVLQRWTPGAVELSVSDDGRGASAGSDGAGHGLLGMRERANMFGGSVTAGPRPGGGFAVHVHLPLPAGAGWQAFETPDGETADA